MLHGYRDLRIEMFIKWWLWWVRLLFRNNAHHVGNGSNSFVQWLILGCLTMNLHCRRTSLVGFEVNWVVILCMTSSKGHRSHLSGGIVESFSQIWSRHNPSLSGLARIQGTPLGFSSCPGYDHRWLSGQFPRVRFLKLLCCGWTCSKRLMSKWKEYKKPWET